MKDFNDWKACQNMLDNLIEGFQLISYEWRYLMVNQSVVTQARLTYKEELLGFTMMEKFPGIEQSDMFKALGRCMAERKPMLIENEFAFPSGEKRWFELRINPAEEGLFILSMDITERKIHEQRLKNHIDRLENMIHYTSHKVRQPVAHMQGFSQLLQQAGMSQDDLQKVNSYMQASLSSLDSVTRELSDFLHLHKISVKHHLS